jgi:hypothetical protein
MTHSTSPTRTAVLLFSMYLSISSSTARGQAASTLPQTLEDVLHHMSDLAGVIFTGEVTDIRHKDGQQGASGIVEIDFRIEQAARGCVTGQTYTLREWAGLWNQDGERYRVGERLLMMLHTPGSSGISSPVEGMDGAIPVRPSPSGAQLLTASNADSQPPLVADLRWVATRIARPLPYATASSSSISAASVPIYDQQQTLAAAQETPLPDLLGMLQSWQQAVP